MKDVKKGKTRLKPLPKKEEPKRKIGLGDSSIRDRLATSRPSDRGDIGTVWAEQHRLVKQRKKQQENEDRLSDILRARLNNIQNTARSFTLSKKKLLNQKWRSFSIPRKKQLKLLSVCCIALIVIFGGLGLLRKNSDPKSLGARTNQSSLPEDGRTDESPDFKPLKPLGKKDLKEVTRRTPSGELIFTYRDEVQTIGIEVTQQKVPETFKVNQADKLKEMASSFQALNVIQIDDMLIYHGLSEKTNVQSLFFIKNESLVSIKASSKISDDDWTGYILSLQ